VTAAAAKELPRHIAIVMDGNGRWAAARGLPRPAGHQAGLKAVRVVIEECSRRGVEALTLFAFSSENWARPPEEVGSLMRLFIVALDREMDELHAQAVRVRFIGARANLAVRLQRRITAAEARTAGNEGLKLQVAMNYGGRWDIVQAAQRLVRACASGALRPDEISEQSFAGQLSLAGLPQADLLIRTGGEQRLSNFLLWELAYAELYFTATLWPDFSPRDFEDALGVFAGRERRFGRSSAPRLAGL
jgi:undecaprenyl diphosphate synthase